MKKVLLAADKSAGHILPAMTLIHFLRETHKVYLFVPSVYHNVDLKGQGAHILPSRCPFKNLLLEMVYRFGEAIYILARYRPSTIIGFGGRSTLFLVMLGRIFCLDTAIYEPNVTFGKANRLLRLFSRRVYTGFTPLRRIKKSKSVGIPLHRHIVRVPKLEARRKIGRLAHGKTREAVSRYRSRPKALRGASLRRFQGMGETNAR